MAGALRERLQLAAQFADAVKHMEDDSSYEDSPMGFLFGSARRNDKPKDETKKPVAPSLGNMKTLGSVVLMKKKRGTVNNQAAAAASDGPGRVVEEEEEEEQEIRAPEAPVIEQRPSAKRGSKKATGKLKFLPTIGDAGSSAPAVPSRRRTVQHEKHSSGIELDEIDAAISEAAGNKKVLKKYARNTPLGRIMQQDWVAEGAAGSVEAGALAERRASLEQGGGASVLERLGSTGGESSPPKGTSKRRKLPRLLSGISRVPSRVRVLLKSRGSSPSSYESISGSVFGEDAAEAFASLAVGSASSADMTAALDDDGGGDEEEGSNVKAEEVDGDDLVPAGSSFAEPTVVVNRNARAFGAINQHARQRPLPGCHPLYEYDCLVFKGGGAKGSIYPGAIAALEELGIMPYIKRFAGASAGSVVAALLAIGLSAKQLFRELANTDLFALIKDGESNTTSKAGRVTNYLTGLYYKFGMNPGAALYRYLGLLFYKYVGNPDVTFLQLWEAFGVELAITVTNVTRGTSELLHVKTAPNYPIRKAVRMSMSLPVIIQPCREVNVHNLIHEDAKDDQHRIHRASMKMKLASNLGKKPAGSFLKKSLSSFSSSKELEKASKKEKDLELYVDGGVLNNYPIDAFDGWWLSMKPEDTFCRKLVGTGGHANYITRFEGHNPKVLGFRLTSAKEPDSMKTRLGNEKVELKVRATGDAALPKTGRARRYQEERETYTEEAKESVEFEKRLRVSMDWLKDLQKASECDHHDPSELLQAIFGWQSDLADMVKIIRPPMELLELLGFETEEALVALLEPVHETMVEKTIAAKKMQAIQRGRKARKQMSAKDLTAMRKSVGNLQAIGKEATERRQKVEEFRLITLEIEKLLEQLSEDLMMNIVGARPVPCISLEKYFMRLVEAIQMCNDERVQTKQNMKRTCFLDTEYVGVVDFKLEPADFDFLWRKGYVTTIEWLKKRASKRKAEDRASQKLRASSVASDAPPLPQENRSASTVGDKGIQLSSAWAKASSWALAERKEAGRALAERREAERKAALLAEAHDSNNEDLLELQSELEVKAEELQEAQARCDDLEKRLRAQQDDDALQAALERIKVLEKELEEKAVTTNRKAPSAAATESGLEQQEQPVQAPVSPADALQDQVPVRRQFIRANNRSPADVVATASPKFQVKIPPPMHRPGSHLVTARSASSGYAGNGGGLHSFVLPILSPQSSTSSPSTQGAIPEVASGATPTRRNSWKPTTEVYDQQHRDLEKAMAKAEQEEFDGVD